MTTPPTRRQRMDGIGINLPGIALVVIAVVVVVALFHGWG